MIPKTVYGSLMHHRAELQALGTTAHQPPYNAPPNAPVLYIKPANTFSGFGTTLHLPGGAEQVQARACLGGIYMANHAPALANTAQAAINNIAKSDWQFAVLCDFTVPHSSFYRPPLRFNAFDGSLALPQSWSAWPAGDLHAVDIETWVNDQRVHRYSVADWMLSAQEQLHAVSAFIAWEAGDVLMLGCPPDMPLVKAGDVVESRMNGQVFTRTLVARGGIA
jgi:5-oxopent-3-ene-1,2,5-tricarboxylate decarboxylase / 2-hydroxyhepta-2,4-diene-1,7-dioate isomerase